VQFRSADPVIRVGVVVTFLRMERPPADPAPPLPSDLEVRIERNCSVETYRALYDTVGASYVWWLRRTVSDRQLALLLRDPAVTIHILYDAEGPAGFYELDRSAWPVVNLSYFGLMPRMVGRHIGHAFLRHAVDAGWRMGARAMTVNTCTADHPRALPTYLRVGFRPVRAVPEEWNVPVRLGLEIPERLRL
jgi:GNAT superfamily N-acetyltransferase